MALGRVPPALLGDLQLPPLSPARLPKHDVAPVEGAVARPAELMKHSESSLTFCILQISVTLLDILKAHSHPAKFLGLWLVRVRNR